MSTTITEHCTCGDTVRIETTRVVDAVEIAKLFQRLHADHGSGTGEGEVTG